MYTHVRPHAPHFLNKEMLTFLQVGNLLSVRSSAGRLCSSQTASRVSSRHSWGSWRARPCRAPRPGRADATRWSRRARSSSAPGVMRAGRVAGGPVSSLRAENGAHGSATLPEARLLPAHVAWALPQFQRRLRGEARLRSALGAPLAASGQPLRARSAPNDAKAGLTVWGTSGPWSDHNL